MAEKISGPRDLTSENDRPSEDARHPAKPGEVEEACAQGDRERLVQLADTPGGLSNDKLRQLAWPILLGHPAGDASRKDRHRSWRELPHHPDEEQVQKDVDRAFVYYPNNEAEKATEMRRKLLFDLIVQTLRCHPMLRYFQGFHDIAQVVMLVLGPHDAFPVVESISLCRIRDYMLPTMTPALDHITLIPAILRLADGQLARHLSLPPVNYALPSAITLYAHEIQEYSDIARLFDFLLAHEPVISIYFFAAIILSRRSQLLEIPSDEPDMLFFTLQKLPQPLNLEPLISSALKLLRDYPPERLPGRIWRQLPSASVLKTSRDASQPQNLVLAEKFFEKQADEIRWQERKRHAVRLAFRHRRPLATTALALGVGALSIWFRKSGNDRFLVSLVLSMAGLGNHR